jgi:hypothetical protein
MQTEYQIEAAEMASFPATGDGLGFGVGDGLGFGVGDGLGEGDSVGLGDALAIATGTLCFPPNAPARARPARSRTRTPATPPAISHLFCHHSPPAGAMGGGWLPAPPPAPEAAEGSLTSGTPPRATIAATRALIDDRRSQSGS